LCRILGFTHEELWGDGGILDGITSYYKRNEITYWQSREKSDLIIAIDKDIDSRIAKDMEVVNANQ
jgi:hypothetical protein